MPNASNKKMKLFWMTTAVPQGEDWFVVAPNKLTARNFFAEAEGFDYEEVRSREVCAVEKPYEQAPAYHGQIDMLEDLGFEILNAEFPRTVLYKGKRYKEGNLILLCLRKMPGVYVLHAHGTDLYKIGSTTDVVKRINTLQTGIPHDLVLENYCVTKHYRRLEWEVHDRLPQKRFNREWFRLSDEDLVEIEAQFETYRGVARKS